MFFYGVLLYGFCVSFLVFIYLFYMCPRLPNSGNSRLGVGILFLFYINYSVIFYLFFFFNISWIIIEGGGWVDVPGLNYFLRN